MKHRKFSRRTYTLLCIIGLLLLGLAAIPAAAQGGPDPQSSQSADGIFFQTTYILPEGQTVDGDLVVIGSTITLQHGSTVTGNVVLVGEQITLRGSIEGEVAALSPNGTIHVEPGARLLDDAQFCGSNVQLDESVFTNSDYRISCDNISGMLGGFFPMPGEGPGWTWENVEIGVLDSESLTRLFRTLPEPNPLDWIVISLGQAMALAGAAALVALLAPVRLRRISQAATIAPVETSIIGTLSFILAFLVSGVVAVLGVVFIWLLIPALLFPLLLIFWFVMAVLLLTGWAGLGIPVGIWLQHRLHLYPITPLTAAPLGTLVLSFLVGLLGIRPETQCLAMPVVLLLVGWGLGAVALTRAGRQPFPNQMHHGTASGFVPPPNRQQGQTSR